ncbi:hypothetical protein [Actinoplanes couchii]|uniref:hypothetical protein n=1 Tax=Actinoplanes couchii TaxID=403638 RepID=UPI0031D4CA85
MTPQDAADWYFREYGERLDIEHIVGALDELGFVRAAGDIGTVPVRGRRLGAALFSPVAWAGYAALVVWAVVAAIRSPDLVPTYQAERVAGAELMQHPPPPGRLGGQEAGDVVGVQRAQR